MRRGVILTKILGNEMEGYGGDGRVGNDKEDGAGGEFLQKYLGMIRRGIEDGAVGYGSEECGGWRGGIIFTKNYGNYKEGYEGCGGW